MKNVIKDCLSQTNPYLKNAENLDYILANNACSSSQIEGIFITPEQLLQMKKTQKWSSF